MNIKMKYISIILTVAIELHLLPVFYSYITSILFITTGE